MTAKVISLDQTNKLTGARLTELRSLFNENIEVRRLTVLVADSCEFDLEGMQFLVSLLNTRKAAGYRTSLEVSEVFRTQWNRVGLSASFPCKE